MSEQCTACPVSFPPSSFKLLAVFKNRPLDILFCVLYHCFLVWPWSDSCTLTSFYMFSYGPEFISPLPVIALSLVKTRTGLDWTGLEVYRKCTGSSQLSACDSADTWSWQLHKNDMACFREERETSVGSCTSIALFQGPHPASRCLQYGPARTAIKRSCLETQLVYQCPESRLLYVSRNYKLSLVPRLSPESQEGTGNKTLQIGDNHLHSGFSTVIPQL